jgi:purine-nucleoside phosphorylase
MYTTPQALYDAIDETVTVIRSRMKHLPAPEVAIILGTGMGQLAQAIEVKLTIPYEELPHFPLSTVESHAGRLVFGTLGGRQVVAMQGRFHYYEGYTLQQVTYPVRVLQALGARFLFVSNAAGAINLKFKKGQLMLLDDHINLLPENPLRGPNPDQLGPRFPDMSRPYDPELINLAQQIAAEEDLPVQTGVYVSVTGPNLETRAEYRFLYRIGADAVGMSTVPEVIVARHGGLRVFACSVLTDECDPDHLEPVALADVLAVAAEAEPKLTRLVTRLLEKLHEATT